MEWISVNDRFPEKDVQVLIYERFSNEPGLMAVSYWDGTYDEYNGFKTYKFPDGQDEQPGFYYPTHWMPLPEPPKTK